MSTRAERRLAEAQSIHQQAVDAHESARAALADLNQRIAAGDDVEALQHATAESEVKIKAGRLGKTGEAVAAEQAVVDEERARRLLRELTEQAQGMPDPFMAAQEFRAALGNYAAAVDYAVDGFQAVRDRVLEQFGGFPWEGPHNAVERRVSGVPERLPGWPFTDRFYLDGTCFQAADKARLEQAAAEAVGKEFHWKKEK